MAQRQNYMVICALTQNNKCFGFFKVAQIEFAVNIKNKLLFLSFGYGQGKPWSLKKNQNNVALYWHREGGKKETFPRQQLAGHLPMPMFSFWKMFCCCNCTMKFDTTATVTTEKYPFSFGPSQEYATMLVCVYIPLKASLKGFAEDTWLAAMGEDFCVVNWAIGIQSVICGCCPKVLLSPGGAICLATEEKMLMKQDR